MVARIGGARGGVLHEVIEADAARVLMRLLTDGTRLPGRDGVFDAASRGPAVLADHEPYVAVPTTLAQTVIACGAAAELKIRRRLLPGRSHEHHLLGALADNLDVELPIAYASLDLLTPDGRRWPFVLLRSPMPSGEDGWERSRQMALRWLAEPHHALPDRSDPFTWLREGRDAPPIDGEAASRGGADGAQHGAPGRGDTPGDRGHGRGGRSGRRRSQPAGPPRGSRNWPRRPSRPLDDLPAEVRRRWSALIGSPAARHLLASRQVLGALARWRWIDGTPTPVDPDDSTPGSLGTDRRPRRARHRGAGRGPGLRRAGRACRARDPRDPQAPAAHAWWAMATWALVRGWQEELAAAGRTGAAASRRCSTACARASCGGCSSTP